DELLQLVHARRVDERLDADVVALVRLRDQLLERALRLEVDVAAREHLVRLVLRGLDVGLVEWVDADHRPRDGDGELPAEELLAELVRIRKPDLLVQLRARVVGRGKDPLALLARRLRDELLHPETESAAFDEADARRFPESPPELEPGIALVVAARHLHLD